MLVGMEVDEENADDGADSSFFDDFNRQCTLSTKQVVTIFLGFCQFFCPVVFFEIYFASPTGFWTMLVTCLQICAFGGCILSRLGCSLILESRVFGRGGH